LAKKSFRSWSRRFPDSFNEESSPKDLSDGALATLVRFGDETNALINDLVMGVKGLGAEVCFDSLEAPRKMAITDIAIFILDQLRFECMRRLGWIEDYPTRCEPLLAMAGDFESRFFALRHETPPLSPSHAGHGEYEATFEPDRGAFLRRLIPEAIRCFEEKVQGGGGKAD
jgi:hypothetical protein